MAFDKELSFRLYYYLKLTRSTEDKIGVLYRQGKILGGAYTARGQEAVSVGYAFPLTDGDVICPYHRDIGAMLVRGISPKEIFETHLGKVTGPSRGKDGNVHLGDINKGVISFISNLADNYPIAAGIALSFKLKGEKKVVAANTGEGSASRGDFHEAMNFAGIHKLPIVFFCNNNQFAYSTPLKLETSVDSIAKRSEGYGFPSISIEGNDAFAVVEAAKEAFERARSGEGPSFIECITMRIKGHSEHDDARYVPKELLKEWELKDPLALLESKLITEGIATKEELQEIEKEVKEIVETDLTEAEKSPLPDKLEAIKGLYATPMKEVKIPWWK